MSKFSSRALLGLGLLLVFLYLGISSQGYSGLWGETDFRAYWGASLLLSQGERFNDHDRLLVLQQTLTGFEENSALMTWNPPWILIVFIPLTLLSFDNAALLWIFINTFFFIWSLEAIWAMWPEDKKVTGRKIWLYASLLLFFPFWNAIAIGQITPMVLFGLVATFYFAETRPVLAGLCLALVTPKPHLVLITFPVLLIDAFYKKNWRLLIGFALALVTLTTIALWLRPSLFVDYFTETGSSIQVGLVEAPLVPYMIANWIGWLPFRYVGVLVVPLALIYWFQEWRQFESPTRLLNLLVVFQLFSLLFAPYGFSFDYILILPIIWALLIVVTPDTIAPWRRAIVLITILLSCVIMIALPIIELKSFKFLSWFVPIICLLYFVIKPFDDLRTNRQEDASVQQINRGS